MQVIEPFQLVKFKSSVLAQQCEKISEQILNYQKYIDPIGRIITNRGGWQSKFKDVGFPFFDQWGEYLCRLSWACYKDYVEKFYEKRYTELYGDREDEQPCSYISWFNINWPGDYNIEHIHLPQNPQPGSPAYTDEFYNIPPEMKNDREFWLPFAAGTFYITDSHNTFFVSKVLIGSTEEEERKYIDLKAGDFIIGSPSLNHGIGVNKQKVPRITIGFNIIPQPVPKREYRQKGPEDSITKEMNWQDRI